MPTERIIALLIAERDKLNRAIEALQGPTTRKEKPRSSTATAGSTEPAQPARKKRRFTAAQRKQQAERMRAFWAVKKKAAVKPQSKAASKSKRAAKAA
jgi:hypothetical protein